MKTLAIETSSSTYTAAVARDFEVLSEQTSSRFDADFDGIGGLIERVLASQGWRGPEITHIVVNAGPGNLTSVRAGLAYGNGLAFATGAELAFTDTLDLIAYIATRQAPARRLLAAHPARGLRGTLLYAALYQHGVRQWIDMVQAADLSERIGPGEPVVICGLGGRIAEAAVPAALIERVDEAPVRAAALLEMARDGRVTPVAGPVSPIVEESTVFAGAR